MIDFGRDVTGRIDVSAGREWLVTNGIGGFAMGTIAGVLTRRYHGLLVAALNPPLGRKLMLAKLDETVYYNNQYYPLYIDQWYGDLHEEPGLYKPNGHFNIERFRLVGTTPHWTYACGDALLNKRIWMQQGENTTYIQYTMLRGSAPLWLYPKAMINFRDYHKTTIAGEISPTVEEIDHGLKINFDDTNPSLYLFHSKGDVYPQDEWHEDYYLSLEEFRGMPDVVEDHLHIADFVIELNPGESVTMIASTRPDPNLDGTAAFGEQQAHEARIIALAEEVQGPVDEAMKHMVVAADQFIVKRSSPQNQNGHSIIAGYPWFSDWGRDTMISIPGLTLCNGRADIGRSILHTYAQYVDQGMLPNRFPDEGEIPEYNTADASLWYFQAIRTYMETTHDLDFLREIFPVLEDIIAWLQKGTRYSIKVDPVDTLLYAGEEGIQLTWMDAKIKDWVVTPRTGKPVEINALWYNALMSMVHFAKWLGRDGKSYEILAARVKAGFERFWCSPEGYCYDVIDGPEGHDISLRPNQLLAVSLSHSPLNADRQKMVLDICTRELLTSHGLRTLAPAHDDYAGRYGGDIRKRDSVYHQGTVWGWLIGPFIAAHLRVYKDPALARSYLDPALTHLNEHGLGSISEIFDGDPPFFPRGCPAQAWSVAEYLRAWCMIRQAEKK
ncbi:MAG: amylo-alpha-1,6-glucosidase [Ardenticatenaceae bacterium]|nr:amylo-alpha-1,6-glucosidase [Ardenticatenaceae bacterium]